MNLETDCSGKKKKKSPMLICRKLFLQKGTSLESTINFIKFFIIIQSHEVQIRTLHQISLPITHIKKYGRN